MKNPILILILFFCLKQLAITQVVCDEIIVSSETEINSTGQEYTSKTNLNLISESGQPIKLILTKNEDFIAFLFRGNTTLCSNQNSVIVLETNNGMKKQFKNEAKANCYGILSCSIPMNSKDLSDLKNETIQRIQIKIGSEILYFKQNEENSSILKNSINCLSQ